MHRIRLILIVSVWAAATTVARADQTDDFIKAQMAMFNLPGLAVAVVKDGAILKTAGYGLADRERGIPVTPETVFKIGSVSKQMIATAVILLAKDGRLQITDPVAKYLPGTPPAWQSITIRHALTHTAGIVRESPAFDPMKNDSDADVIAATYAVPLRFVPGCKWEYSNVGYYVLAEIITRVSGRPWTQFIQERIFTPAGMTVTAPTNATPMPSNHARGYTGNDNTALAGDWLALRPSGAFRSTVLDVAKWEALLYTNRLLTQDTLSEMWTRVPLSDGTSHAYGFGWHVENWRVGPIVWHGGGLPGFSAYLIRFVDQRLSVAVLTNGDDSDIASIAMGVAALYLPAPPSAPLTK